jgi:hypothetical protein
MKPGQIGDSGPSRVLISSGAVHWPRSCVCCLQKPGLTLPLAGAGASWDVPYCGRCAEHVRMYDESLTHLRPAAMRSPLVSFIAMELALAIALAGLWWAVSAGQVTADVAIALSVLGLLGSTAIVVMMVARRRSAESSDVAFDRAAAGMDDRCMYPGPAVEYCGRDAAGHTFLVFNRSYADAFTAANDGKIVV